MLILDVGTNVYLIGNCRCLRDHTNEVFLRDSTSRIELTGWEKVCPVLGCLIWSNFNFFFAVHAFLRYISDLTSIVQLLSILLCSMQLAAGTSHIPFEQELQGPSK